MKIAFLSVLLVFQISLASAIELSEEKANALRELFKFTGEYQAFETIGETTSNEVIEKLRARGEKLDPEVLRIIRNKTKQIVYEEFVTKGRLEKIFFDVYGSYYTLEEVQELNRFFRTKAGEKYLAEDANNLKRLSSLVAKQFEEVNEIIQKSVLREVNRKRSVP